MVRRSKHRVGRGLTVRQKRQVKGIAGRDVETKFIDTSSPGNAPSATSIVITGSFCNSPQGVVDNGHTGDRIKLKKVSVRTGIVAADSTNFVRIVWFQWTPNNTTSVPSAAALFQNPASASWNSALNETNGEASLFRVMSDKTYALTATGNGAKYFTQSFYGRRIPRKRVEFNPTSATGFNQIYCAMFSDSIAASHPTINHYVRVEFTDK